MLHSSCRFVSYVHAVTSKASRSFHSSCQVHAVTLGALQSWLWHNWNPGLWLNQPIWKILYSQIGSFFQIGMKIKEYFKPPQRISFTKTLPTHWTDKWPSKPYLILWCEPMFLPMNPGDFRMGRQRRSHQWQVGQHALSGSLKSCLNHWIPTIPKVRMMDTRGKIHEIIHHRFGGLFWSLDPSIDLVAVVWVDLDCWDSLIVSA